MSTPFDELIRMLKQRLTRQEKSLEDTRLQLAAAERSRNDAQKDIVAAAGKK
jgi:hypothetical protein